MPHAMKLPSPRRLLARATAFLAPVAEIRTEAFIAAPPALVWRLLTDAREHQGWNPNMDRVEGEFVEGARLRLVMKTPAGRRITFRPRILTARPGQELRWLGRLGLPGLFDGEHRFTLHAEAGGTRLVHGERFRGVLLWVMNVRQFEPGFAAANAGLKRRAEALARNP